MMSPPLNEFEARVLGCLVEKELATPDYYPLTLNALVNACNQKSNRDPVMNLEAADVQTGLDGLRSRQLAHRSAEGVRTAKYCHNLEGRLGLEPKQTALLAELLLRGPQTLGELRSRADRMTSFADLTAVEEAVTGLLERDPPLVVRLPRQPGRKEHRYAQLLTPPPEPDQEAAEVPAVSAPDENRLADLEAEVSRLHAELVELRQNFETFKTQFE
ncbi:MAG TPA: YceH family protein [Desulfuromonadales bacterium]|nr:YceH family protein [Desulfuromonadales bacterium]